jgi:hypothetical protein
MMYRLLTTIFFITLTSSLAAQSDSLPKPAPKKASLADRIGSARAELLQAFLNDDPAGAALWRDSLMRLETATQSALMWDERWLLYFWEESYGNLLEEAAGFDDHARYLANAKTAPPGDSLFTWLDHVMYDSRFNYFNSMAKGFLSQEEKAFATLLFEYLLRLNTDASDWNARTNTFIQKYPTSRFNTFLKTTQTPEIKAGNSGFNLDIMLQSGTFTGALQSSLTQLWGLDVGLTYWRKRLNVGFHFTIGGPKLHRDIYQLENSGFYYTWPKGDPTTFMAPELELGYDVVNNQKIRLFPSVGAGWNFLRPPTPDESEDPLPDYYVLFKYNSGHWLGSLTADIKFPMGSDGGVAKGSYHGVRLRAGYRKMYLGNDNTRLDGDMIFLSIGYNLFFYNAAR